MAALGVNPEDIAGDVEVWPENAEAVVVFRKLRTQWNVVAMVGRVGLQYDAFWALVERLKIPEDRQLEVFGAVQVMEQAVLEMSAEKAGG